jgi:hypothetical protein
VALWRSLFAAQKGREDSGAAYYNREHRRAFEKAPLWDSDWQLSTTYKRYK